MLRFTVSNVEKDATCESLESHIVVMRAVIQMRLSFMSRTGRLTQIRSPFVGGTDVVTTVVLPTAVAVQAHC